MAVALDYDTVVGFLDRSDALHDVADEAVRRYARSDRLVASAITYSEVMTGAKIGHHDESLVAGFFETIVRDVLPIDIGIADRAATLRARNRSLRMPDALIVATADLDPAIETIVTGDSAIAKLKRLSCRVVLIAPQD